MKKYLLQYIFVSLSLSVWAQQDPLYSQYINNPLVLNPAIAGLENDLRANISYRNQWSGLEGSPRTINANAHMSILDNTAGAGVMVLSDRIGSTSVTEAYAIGAYRIHVAADKVLSFGLQTGVINYSLNNSKLNPYDRTDPYFEGTVSTVKPGFGAGVFFKTSRFNIGLSVPRLLPAKAKDLGYQFDLYSQHFYLMGSYQFLISHNIQLRPVVLLKAVQAAPLSVDLNVSAIFDDKYSVGILTRNFNTYGLLGRIQILDKFSLGYVYEIPTGKSVGTQYSTNEITLGFQMKTTGK